MTDTENKPLTQKQAKALAALLTHQTIADAANEAGVTDRTLYRYLNDPNFAAQLREQQAVMIADNVRRLTGMSGDALTALKDLMDSSDSDSVKVRAAKEILSGFLKYREILNLESRILELERRMDETDK